MRAPASLRVIAFVSLSLLAAACQRDNPNCEGDLVACPEPSGDARIDAPIACTAAMPCDQNGTTPFCVEGTCVGCTDAAACETLGDDRDVCLREPPGATYGECVACDEDDRQAAEVGGAGDDCRTVGLQVCDGGSHTCRACGADVECAGGLCASGTCIATDQIAYAVAAGGTDNAMCSQAMPCASLRQAVATARPFILVAPGLYTDTQGVDLDNRNLTVHATGATLGQTNTNTTILRVRGTSQVVVQGGTFDGTGDGNNAVITQTDAGSALTLEGVTATNSAGNGITASSGRLVVRRSTITMNAGVGLYFDSTTQPFEATRSTISRNAGGGVHFRAQSATVMNNFIVRNSAGGGAAALLVMGLTTPGTSRLEFNTIAGNLANATTLGAAVTCFAAATIQNSILFSNTGASQSSVLCTVRYSTVQGATPDPPNGIIADAPGFLNLAGDDFRLMPGSPVAGKADPEALLTGPGALDHAGDARPMPAGSAADLGADEIP